MTLCLIQKFKQFIQMSSSLLRQNHSQPVIIEEQVTSDRSSLFFEELYASYTQIWQEVVKLTSEGSAFIPADSFVKCLVSSGIQVNDPYCMFLLDTCTIKEEGLIDFKLFLNTSIKTKISTYKMPFNDEQFIIDHFWRAKFPVCASGANGLRSPSPEMLISENQRSIMKSVDSRQNKVPIEIFNEAFYSFFNRNCPLLEIEQVQAILNECFQYLLRKNKKTISKRTVRTVITRCFKFVFPMIIHRYHKKTASSDHTKSTETQQPKQSQARVMHSADRKILNEMLQKQSIASDSLNHQYSSTTGKPGDQSSAHINCNYPDSLDTRCPSMLQQMSTSMAQLDKTTAVAFATSQFSKGECDISSLQMDAVFKLFNSLSRVNKRIQIAGAFNQLNKFTRRRKSKSKQQKMSLIADKENMRPQQQQWNDTLDHIMNDQAMRSRTINHKTNSQLGFKQNSTTTFSFNNTGNQEDYLNSLQPLSLNPSNLTHGYYNSQSHTLLNHYYQDEPHVYNIVKKNTQSHMGSNQQSIGSLAFSNTSTKDKNKNNFANLSSVKETTEGHMTSCGPHQISGQGQIQQNDVIPFSTKSSMREQQQQYQNKGNNYPQPVSNNHLQHLIFKPCCEQSEQATDSNHQHSQYQLINDINGQAVVSPTTNTTNTAGYNPYYYQQQIAMMAPPTIYTQDDSKSLQTNATISTRRNERGYLYLQMPPISGGRNMYNGNSTMKGRRNSAKNTRLLVNDIKCSSTPKMVTSQSNFLNQEMINQKRSDYPQHIPQPVTVNPNHTSSTIDYSACTLPQSSSRRPLSQQPIPPQQQIINRGNMTLCDSRDRFDSGSASRNRRGRKENGVVSSDMMLQERMSYYEKKYRKSKRRVKKLISDNVTEKTKNLEMHSNHCTLVAQYEVLEKTKQLLHKAQLARLSHFFSANLRHRLLHSTFSGLKLCSRVHSTTLCEKLQHFTFIKQQKILRSLRNYAVDRNQRRLQHRLAKLRAKLLKRVLLKHNVTKLLRQSLTKWRVCASGMQRVSQVEQMVRQDIASASHQMTLMRRIIAVTKLEKVCTVRERDHKVNAFGKIMMARGAHKVNTQVDRQRSQSRNKGLQKMDFNQKLNKSRMQQSLVEGIEKLYQIYKKRQGERKKTCFQKWQYVSYDDIMGQLDQSNDVLFQLHHHLQPQQQQLQTAVFSQTFNNNKNRASSLNQPSFYKTNEGFFSAEQENRRSRMQSTTVVFTPSPKQGVANISFNYQSEGVGGENDYLPMACAPKPHPQISRSAHGSNSSRDDYSYNYPRQVVAPLNSNNTSLLRVPYHNLPPITSRSGIKKGGILKRSRSAEKRENQESRCINSNEMNQALSEAVEYLKAKINRR